MQTFIAFICGMIFAVGLVLSGMTNPAKIKGFLDLAGNWDPSLAMVMAGAISVGFIAFRMASQRKKSLLGCAMQLPTARDIDRRLVGGSVLFGIGWGLAGYCPGPALASLGLGDPKPLVFVTAMLTGMLVFEFLEQRKRD